MDKNNNITTPAPSLQRPVATVSQAKWRAYY